MLIANARPKILVVDPQHDTKETLTTLLGEIYRPVEATSKEDALRQFRENPDIELILTSTRLPDGDGYALCAELRAEQRTQSVPILLMAVDDEAPRFSEAFGLGVRDFLRAPLQTPLVLQRIKTQLEIQFLRRQVEHASVLDGLTGVKNRHYFDETLKREWNRARRNRRALSLILVDMDYFKQFNKMYGHQAGDDCLKLVAQAMARTVKRPGDFVARYNGEEFAVLLPETESDAAYLVGETLRKQVEALEIENRDAEEVGGHVTVTLGLASLVPTADLHEDRLIEAAEKALDIAKNAGRNQIKVVSSTTQDT